MRTIEQMAKALRARQVSSVELTEESLRAIDRLEGKLNAFITVTADQARAEAKKADEELRAGRDRGPLHGIPFAHKDLVCTAGVRTTGGSLIHSKFVPETDAPIHRNLREAGAVMVGKTNLHEHAYGVTSNNPHFGPVHNPWELDAVPGGSSGGSGAAVAAGIVPMATGSDTGGSIRCPASYCGVVGLKPRFGLVPKAGVLPLGFSLDHMGPLTRTVRDAALSLAAMAPHWKAPQGQGSLKGVRLGVPEGFFFERLDPEVEAAVRGAIALAGREGAVVTTVKLPDIPKLNAIARVLLLAEAAAAHEPYRERRDQYGADVLTLLDAGRLLPATEYVQAQRLRRKMMAAFDAVLNEVDVLMTPCTPIPAPRIGQAMVDIAGNEEDMRLATTRLLRGINPLGLPALSLPCGLTKARMPMGLQMIAGRSNGEEMLIRAGGALERELGLDMTSPV